MAETVADQFVETLAAAGVRRIYGIVGDSLNGVTDAVRRHGKIERVHLRHEEVAAFAVGIAGEQPVPIERNSSMRPESKLVALTPGSEAPWSEDRKIVHFTGTLLSRVAPNTGGSSAQPGSRAGDPLTARERDILTVIGNGLSNKRVARALRISPETVKSHVKNIFLKLAVSTRAEAVFRAGSLGLLRSWEPAPRENAIASSGG
jgi:DNA-binding CsgD family transcriptional regulator